MLTVNEHNRARLAAHAAHAKNENATGACCPECFADTEFASLLLMEGNDPPKAPVACPRCGWTGELVL